MDINDKEMLNYLKNVLRYCKKYERYELERDYLQTINYITQAIDFSDSQMKSELIKIKGMIENKDFSQATNGLELLIRRENADIITFPDKNLELIIREAVNMPEGNIKSTDVESITYLNASNKKISNLKGISYLTNLKYLDLSFNQLCDQEAAKQIRDLGNLGVVDTLKMSFTVPFIMSELNELSQLKNLEELNLSGNTIKDISFLKGLNNLAELDFGYCFFIDDIIPISSLSNLEVLTLTHNMVENVEALENLKMLRRLDLSNNKLRNINPIGSIINLEDLDVSNIGGSNNKVTSFNSISDVQALINLPNLRFLDIDNNPVRKIKDLSKSKSLESVRFNGKNIENLDELGGYYLDFRRLHTKPLGCLISLSLLILLLRYAINSYSNGNPMGGLPIFALSFPSAVFILWEAYRLDDRYNKVRGWVILVISFGTLIFGNGYQ